MKERKFISESVKKLLVTEYIRKETDSAGFGGMEMKRTPFGTSITLFVNKPGLVIGRRGGKIQEITATLERRFGVETPQIEVKEVANPDLTPQVVAKKIAISLEKGWSYRKAGNTTLRRTIENNAKGVLIKIAGKISGERARSQKFISGSIKYSGEPGREGMATGFSPAKLKLGIIGVSVKILDSNYKLPDHITVKPIPAEQLIVPETVPEPKLESVPTVEVTKAPEKKQPKKKTAKAAEKKSPKKETVEKEEKPVEKEEKPAEKVEEIKVETEKKEEKPGKKAAPKKSAARKKAEPKAAEKPKKQAGKSKSTKEKKKDAGTEGKKTEGNE